MERASLQQKLAAAARNEEAVWTPDCLEPDDLIALIEEGANTPAAVARMAHVVSCAHCRQEFDEMEQTLQIAARARELQAPASVPVRTTPGTTAEEAKPKRPPFVPWWRRLLGPSLGFAFGVAAAVLLLYFGMVRPLQVQEAALEAHTTDLQIRFAQMTRQKQVAGDRAGQIEKDVAKIQKEKETLQQKAAQSQRRIAALETRIAQITRSADGDRLALDALQLAATTTEQAMSVLTETQRTMGSSGPEKSPVRLLSPVASVLLNNRVPFRWDASANATSYTVAVLDSASKQVAKSPPLKDTEWTALLPPARGESALAYYEWVVIAHKDGQEVGRSAPIKFAVLDTKRLVEEVKAKRKEP
jgi:hypothetical protein